MASHKKSLGNTWGSKWKITTKKNTNSCAIQTPKGKESSKEKSKIESWGNNISVSCGVKYEIGSVFNSQTVEERNKTLVVKKMYSVC